MDEKANGGPLECVVIDLNTQHDFCLPEGARPVRNTGELLPRLRRVIAWTKWNRVPVVSSMDSHRECELLEAGVPLHCVEGTPGQRKLPFTVFHNRVCVQADNTLCVPLDLFSHCQQVVFRQRRDDLLGNPKADRFLTQLPARRYLVFGNVLEGAVKAVALGLVARERNVCVIVDACGYYESSSADLTRRLLEAKGVQLINTEELAGIKYVRRISRTPKPRSTPLPQENAKRLTIREIQAAIDLERNPRSNGPKRKVANGSLSRRPDSVRIKKRRGVS